MDKAKEIIKDVMALDDRNAAAAVRQLNSHDNIQHFTRRGVDMEKVLKQLVIHLLKKKINIPVGGYYDLRKHLESKKKSKKKSKK